MRNADPGVGVDCRGASLNHEERHIESLLFREPRGVLSLTGGGGKTSLMFHLSRKLAASGKKVLVTTTTRILYPTADQSEMVVVSADPVELLGQATESRAVTAGCMVKAGKLIGFAPEVITLFASSGLFDWILVEADGASRRPLKAPAEHEPVIPVATSMLLAVAGLDVVGEPLSEELVFRSERAGGLMGLTEGDIITESAVADLLAHPLGSFKGAPATARRYIFLNKADNPARCTAGATIADLLHRRRPPIAEMLFVGQALNGIQVHAVHYLGANLNSTLLAAVPAS